MLYMGYENIINRLVFKNGIVESLSFENEWEEWSGIIFFFYKLVVFVWNVSFVEGKYWYLIVFILVMWVVLVVYIEF